MPQGAAITASCGATSTEYRPDADADKSLESRERGGYAARARRSTGTIHVGVPLCDETNVWHSDYTKMYSIYNPSMPNDEGVYADFTDQEMIPGGTIERDAMNAANPAVDWAYPGSQWH